MQDIFGIETYIFALGGMGFCTLLMGLYLIMHSHPALHDDLPNPTERVRRSAGCFLIVFFVAIQLCASIQITFIDTSRYLYVVAYTVMCTMTVCCTMLFQWLCSLLQHRESRRMPTIIMVPAMIAVASSFGVLVSDCVTDFPDEFEGCALYFFAAFVAMWMVFVISFLWWFVRQVAVYHKWLEDNFSSFYRRSLTDLRYIAMVAVVTIAVIFLANIVPGEWWWLNTMVPVCLSIFCAMVFVFTERLVGVEVKRKDSSVGATVVANAVSDGTRAVVLDNLEERVVSGNLFLNPDLTLEDLANVFGLSCGEMSRYFEQRGISFYNYINSLRVDRAVRILNESPDINHQELAQRSGFYKHNSLAHNFKAFKGITIGQYLEKIAR